MQFWSFCYTVVSYQALLRLSVCKISAVYLSGAKRVFLHDMRLWFPDYTTAQYMQFLTLTSINNFVIKEIFAIMIMGTTIFLYYILSLKSDNLNIYAEIVTSNFLEFCKRTIPNKTITIIPLDPPRINNEIRKKWKQKTCP